MDEYYLEYFDFSEYFILNTDVDIFPKATPNFIEKKIQFKLFPKNEKNQTREWDSKSFCYEM